MAGVDRHTRSGSVSKDARGESFNVKDLVLGLESSSGISNVVKVTKSHVTETGAQSKLKDIFNFIENELDPGKKMSAKGKSSLKDKLSMWALEQANLEGQLKILKEENENLKRQVQTQSRPLMQTSYATVASAPTEKNLKTQIQRQAQKQSNVLFITSDTINSGKKIQEEFTKIVNPRTNKLRISKMRTTPRSLIVETATKDDLEKIKSNAQVMGKFVCEPPKKRNPLVIIYDVPSRIQDKEFTELIREQNFDSMSEENFNDAFKVRFKTGPKGKATAHVVAEVKPEMRRQILGGKLYVEFNCLTAKDYLVVPKCLKCLDLGHVSKHCPKKDSACQHCGESHDKKDCTKSEQPKVCVPCKNRNKKCSTDKKDCPTHKIMLERLIQKTDYGQ